MILIQFYSPDPTQANLSVREISTELAGGGFIRGMHYWGSQAMYVLAALHMIRVFLTASYKKPREGNWLIGVAMFALTFVAIFTGTVLKWDQEGFEALLHNFAAVDVLGGAGWIVTPDFSPNVSILDRVYGAHILIIPGLITLALVVHLLLVKFHKISPHPLLPGAVDGQAPTSEPTESFDGHLRRATAFGLVLIGILGLLALILPPLVGTPAVSGVEITTPGYQYWMIFALENWFGISAILWGSALLFGLLAIVPFVDRNPERHPKRRKIAIIVGGLFLLAYIALTLVVLILPAQDHLGM